MPSHLEVDDERVIHGTNSANREPMAQDTPDNNLFGSAACQRSIVNKAIQEDPAVYDFNASDMDFGVFHEAQLPNNTPAFNRTNSNVGPGTTPLKIKRGSADSTGNHQSSNFENRNSQNNMFENRNSLIDMVFPANEESASPINQRERMTIISASGGSDYGFESDEKVEVPTSNRSNGSVLRLDNLRRQSLSSDDAPGTGALPPAPTALNSFDNVTQSMLTEKAIEKAFSQSNSREASRQNTMREDTEDAALIEHLRGGGFGHYEKMFGKLIGTRSNTSMSSSKDASTMPDPADVSKEAAARRARLAAKAEARAKVIAPPKKLTARVLPRPVPIERRTAQDQYASNASNGSSIAATGGTDQSAPVNLGGVLSHHHNGEIGSLFAKPFSLAESVSNSPMLRAIKSAEQRTRSASPAAFEFHMDIYNDEKYETVLPKWKMIQGRWERVFEQAWWDKPEDRMKKDRSIITDSCSTDSETILQRHRETAALDSVMASEQPRQTRLAGQRRARKPLAGSVVPRPENYAPTGQDPDCTSEESIAPSLTNFDDLETGWPSVPNPPTVWDKDPEGWDVEAAATNAHAAWSPDAFVSRESTGTKHERLLSPSKWSVAGEHQLEGTKSFRKKSILRINHEQLIKNQIEEQLKSPVKPQRRKNSAHSVDSDNTQLTLEGQDAENEFQQQSRFSLGGLSFGSDVNFQGQTKTELDLTKSSGSMLENKQCSTRSDFHFSNLDLQKSSVNSVSHHSMS